MNRINKLQYISQGKSREDQICGINAALLHGVKWVQLRWKEVTKEELFDLAELVQVHCVTHQAKLIINDHVDIANSINADGVHLGLDDMSVVDARQILGERKIIGGTANTLDDVLLRIKEGCDYIGLGPYRFTTTKSKLSPILGLEGYELIIKQLKDLGYNLPVVAIGGIKVEDIPDLQKLGVFGIALSSYINHNPKEVTYIKALLNE